jgi:sulfoxide reductase heme-binding subunit YedZ
LKPVVGVAAAVPAARIAVLLVADELGANPIAEVLNRLGWWSLVGVLATLACTPLKLLLDWNWPLRLRRLLGLAAFGYTLLHFATYLVLDQGLEWLEVGRDIVKRPFITVGFVALLLMTPLALTSTNRMVKRLGFARWKRLHRLVYVVGILGVVHFVWRVKIDLREPLAFAAILAALLGARIVGPLIERRRAGRPSPPRAARA